MRKLKRILLVVSVGLLLLFGSALLYYLIVTGGERIDPEKLVSSAYNLQIYDDHETLVEEVSSVTQRKNIQLGELNPYTVEAFLSIEDKQFFHHNGLNYGRIAKALWNNLKAHSFREGASTISQQLIKNTHLTNEKTINRKLKEWKLTRQLERDYSKEEILEIYLNSVYFGHNAFGIADASYYYFGKTPDCLSLSESALLAGLLRSPNSYSPFRHPEQCLARRNLVLKELRKDQAVSESAYYDACQDPLPAERHIDHTSAYLELVFNELETQAERLGLSNFHGLKLYTNWDTRLQSDLDQLPTGDYDKNFIVTDNAAHAVIACSSTTGEIPRSPGSVIKPLLVYAPALEEDLISPATPVLDEPIDINGYRPRNYNNGFRGYVSVREAVAQSINIPAVKILNTLGVDRGVSYLRRMDLNPDSASLALALGGMEQGFSLADLVNAYALFAQNGIYTKQHALRAIVTPTGKTYQMPTQSRQVFSEDTVSLMNDMLRYTAQNGTAKKLKSLPYPVYAKTGTAGTAAGNTDAYTISYTKDHTVGVWLGNADYSLFTHTGGGEACQLCKKIYECLYKESYPEPIPQSDSVIRCSLDKNAYQTRHALLLADDNAPVNAKFYDLFKKTACPKQQSDYFTHPTVAQPSICYADGVVTINLCQTDYYSVLVERLDRNGVHCVYDGPILDSISDIIDQNGDKYLYQVTPYYQNCRGKTILLPAVTTKASASEPLEPQRDPIQDKNWWEL